MQNSKIKMKNDNAKTKIYRILNGILFLLIFGSMPFFAKAATYYVDSAAGNDSNLGTDVAHPWKSTEKVNGTVLLPGDHILFKKGDVWHGQIKPYTSGTEENPIVFSTYGSGNNPLIINGKFFPAGTAWSGPDANGEYFLEIGSTAEFAPSSIIGVLRGQPVGVDSYKRVFLGKLGALGEDEVATDLISGKRIVHYKPLAGHKPAEYDWEFSKWHGTVHFGETTSWIVVDGFTIYGGYYGRLDQTSLIDLGVVNFFGSHCVLKNSVIRFANAMGAEFQGPAS